MIAKKQPTASKSTLSKDELQALEPQVLELLIAEFPKSKVSEYLATASESLREARRKDVLKHLDLGSALERFPRLLKDPIAFKRQLKISTASQKELEATWKENKKFKHDRQVDLFIRWDFQDPKFRKLAERPKTLCGPDFVGELMRLSVITGDERFADAVTALIEHGIIDKKKNFTRWQSPFITESKAHKNGVMLREIRALLKEGRSTRRACMETAATYGLRANSFDAAIKQLQLLYASDGKKGAA